MMEPLIICARIVEVKMILAIDKVVLRLARARCRFDLVAIFVFAAIIGIIRGPYLGHQSFWWDEAVSVLAAQGIVKHSFPLLPSGMLYKHSPLFSYLEASALIILGSHEFSARIISLLFSSLTLPIIYLFGKAIGNKQVGTLGAIIVAFSPWAVTWARQARMYAQFQFFYSLTLYLFYKIYVDNHSRISHKYNAILIVSFICALLSHELALSLIPSLFVYLAITRGIKWMKKRNVVIGAIALALFCIVFFFFSNGSFVYGLTGFNLSWLQHNLLRSYNPFFTKYPVLTLFVVMGTSVLLFKRDNKLLYLYVNLVVPLHFVPLTVVGLGARAGQTIEVYDRYLFFIFPIFALAASSSLLQHINSAVEVIVEKFNQSVIRGHRFSRDSLRKSIAWIILLLIIFPVFSNINIRVFVSNTAFLPLEALSHYQPGHRNPRIDIDIDYGGVRGACEFIKQRYQDGDAIISTSARSYSNEHAPTYYYLQEIITRKNVTLFYFMLEPWLKKDAYLNSTIISTVNELQDAFEHYKNVWIIIEDRTVFSFTSNEAIAYLVENAQLVYENKDEHIHLYEDS